MKETQFTKCSLSVQKLDIVKAENKKCKELKINKQWERCGGDETESANNI